ncbi:carbohydrate ABC transporter permease [Spirochaeta cellobiosiphila]|uniref:carbohydrate ABC transporter permease n=1 Tax=Spirochaeta cellobiosiphila TaxID=504483 RepID=UPI00041C7DD5|nr:carbohydrate ABC transporter permease [Spirochaeta cellobiosiphila]
MRKTRGDVIFDTIKIIMILFLCVVTLYPFLNTLAIALNDPMDSLKGGIGIWPRILTFSNFKDIIYDEFIGIAFRNSLLRTVISALVQTYCTAMVAYTLSRKEFSLRVPIAIIYVITMYIDGGLIPTYFLYRKLHLVNSFHVYWLPGLTTAWNMMVIRTYMRGLPESLVESAKLEGAGDFMIFRKIILPLSTPVLATIVLFTSVWQWNTWFDTFIFNSAKINLTTLQYELMKKIQSANAAISNTSMSDVYSNASNQSGNSVTPKSLRAAMTIVVSLPIIMAYPFLQKYFVSGLTIGGVKG